MILRPLTYTDIPTLSQYDESWTKLTDTQCRDMLDKMHTPREDGKYYEIFAVENEDGVTVGTVSLFQHTRDAVSAGPEIFTPYRRRGYATEALNMAYAHAAARGFRVAVAQVRLNNTASLALHRKCGFESDHEFVNRHGNRVAFLIKAL